MTPTENLIAKFRGDRWFAHRMLFGHRHDAQPALFHEEMVADFWSEAPRLVTLGFRGGGKSTYLEEGIALAACECRFRNCIIIGASETRARERVAAISRELTLNEALVEIYGEQQGDTWTQTELVLRSERRILALGRDQDIRGIKFLQWRPDFVVVDDFEDKMAVQSPEGRKKTMRWFLAELLPACDPKRKIRVYGTPMDAESVPVQLGKHALWPSKTFPVAYREESGALAPSWPSAYPMAWIEAQRADYIALGEPQTWAREYMCDPTSDEARDFKVGHMRVEPQRRTWQATWAMYDPARTNNPQTSATTGWAVWSWVGSKLIVWDGGGEFWRPSELIDHLFRVNAQYSPVAIGVEETGLNLWLRDSVRSEIVRRGIVVPFKPLPAPRGKISFIRGLEPHFAAGEVVFAKELPEMRAQLLGFPNGRIDAPNALAYALTLRPGIPIYDSLQPSEHITERIPYGDARFPLWLATNATGAFTTAVLVAAGSGRLSILADWVREGDPGVVAAEIVREASLESRAWLRVTAPPPAFDPWNNVGLVQALRAVPVEVTKGGLYERGRAYLRAEMQRVVRGTPTFQISERAKWTLNGLLGGYARKLGAPEPEPGIYRTLIEGLESFAALFAMGATEEEDIEAGFVVDRWGRRYKSAMPPRHDQRTH